MFQQQSPSFSFISGVPLVIIFKNKKLFQTMQTSNQDQKAQEDKILNNLSLSNRLQKKWKNIPRLQSNNHFLLIITKHTIKLLSVIHIVLSYLQLEPSSQIVKKEDIQASVSTHISVYWSIQLLLYISKVVNIATIALVVRGRQEKLTYSIANRVLKHINIISEVDLLVTSVYLLVNFKKNIASFIISSVISIGINIGFDSYTNRKQEGYQASQTDSLIFSCIHILLFLANSILACIGNALYYYIFNLTMGVLIFIWYLTSGINLYHHSRPKYFVMAFVSLYLTFLYLLVERIILKTDVFSMNKLASYAIIFSFCFSFLFEISKNMKYRLTSGAPYLAKNLKKIELLWFNDLRSCSFHFDDASFLAGCFKSHLTGACSNPKCYSNFQSFYDPMSKTSYSLPEVGKEKEVHLRFYVKCLYERCLQDHWNLQLLLDYGEFLVNEYFDIYLISKLLAIIDLQGLNLFDSLRLYRLKIAVKKQATVSNELIYDGKLQIEKALKADLIYQDVLENINRYLEKSIIVWTAINRDQVNLTSITQSFKKIFKVLHQIENIWVLLAPEFTLHKKWKALKIKYSHFILNKKLRQRDSQTIKMLEARQEISYFESKQKKKKLFAKKLLFDKNTMYIQTAIKDNLMYMVRTNKRFQEISHYGTNQLKGVQLDYFLPEDVRMVHNSLVKTWLQSGLTNNQACYPVRFTEFINKEGQLIPVIKYFKILFNAEASRQDYLHFVCMLKINNKNDIPSQQPIYEKKRQTTRISDIFSGEEQKVEINPFLKEENLQPKKMIVEVSRIKRVLRAMVIILVINTISLAIITYQNANDLNAYSIQYINFLNLYRYPMGFGKNILKTMMNVGNQSKTIDQIHSQSAMMTALMSDPMTLQSIFDQDLNIPKMYYPFQNNSFNKGIAYDQIDLIFYMVSTMQSLNQLPANRTGEYFTNFNMYITSYDILVNSTKIRFHDSFKGIFNSMSTNQVIFLVIGIFIFVSSTTFVSYLACIYFQKTKEIIKTVIEFGQEDIQKIISYFKQLQYSLCNVNDEQTVRGKHRQTSKRKLALIKKNKHIYQSKRNNMRDCRRTALIVMLVLVMLVGTCGFEVTNMITIDNIFSFEEDGFYFLRYFPATSVLGHAILERYYSQLYPKEITFYPERYLESITNLGLIARTPYIGEVFMPESAYFQYQKNYLFGNPCTFNPSVLIGAQTSQTKCISIYNSTFSMGITAFLRACQQQVNDFLNGKIKLSSSQVDELTVALTLVAYYITDAIMTWSSELTSMIMDFNNNTSALCIVICIGLLLFHFLFCEYLIFPYLEEDYCFHRNVYERMVPQEILASDKVTKQKFVIHGILRQ